MRQQLRHQSEPGATPQKRRPFGAPVRWLSIRSGCGRSMSRYSTCGRRCARSGGIAKGSARASTMPGSARHLFSGRFAGGGSVRRHSPGWWSWNTHGSPSAIGVLLREQHSRDSTT